MSCEPRFPWLLLRAALGLQFIAAGAFSLRSWSSTVSFNAILTGPALASGATAVAVALTVIGGLSLLTGVRARWGALCLLAFLVPATVRHIFAAQQAVATLAQLVPADAAVNQLGALAHRGQMAAVAKNVALIGVVAFIALRGLPSNMKRRA